MDALTSKTAKQADVESLVLQFYGLLRGQRSRWLRLIAQYEKNEALAEELLSVVTLRLVQRASSGELVIQTDPEAYVRMTIESVCCSHVAREIHRKSLGLYYWHEQSGGADSEEAFEPDAASAEPTPAHVLALRQSMALLEEALQVVEKRQPRNVGLWREVTLEGKGAQEVARAHRIDASVVHKAVYAVNKALQKTPQAQAARECLDLDC